MEYFEADRLSDVGAKTKGRSSIDTGANETSREVPDVVAAFKARLGVPPSSGIQAYIQGWGLNIEP